MSDDVRDESSNPESGQLEDVDDRPDLSSAVPAEEIQRTGNPVVDSVLDSLRDLENVPVSEHVAVFEAAHDRLRGALSDAGEPPSES